LLALEGAEVEVGLGGGGLGGGGGGGGLGLGGGGGLGLGGGLGKVTLAHAGVAAEATSPYESVVKPVMLRGTLL
jgi:hypothetical protein